MALTIKENRALYIKTHTIFYLALFGKAIVQY